jgi:hypothetical protein
MRGLSLFFTALFYINQNNYFGWNMTPQSDAEMICDGITILLAMLCVLVWHNKPHSTVTVSITGAS